MNELDYRRKVVRSEQRDDYRIDHLECGHMSADFSKLRVPRRRLCPQCMFEDQHERK